MLLLLVFPLLLLAVFSSASRCFWLPKKVAFGYWTVLPVAILGCSSAAAVVFPLFAGGRNRCYCGCPSLCWWT